MAQAAVSSSLHSIYGKLSNQPESYERKSKYRFGRVLGAGTYGIVKTATTIENGEQVAVKIILKKNVKGHESMVYDELNLLRSLNHPHIVGFRDWFESREKFYIVTQLATGGELFDRICERGKYTEKDAVETVREILQAVDYLHDLNIVHRDLKPENLLYLTPAKDSSLVLADFGIAKMLEENEILTSMAGSFGYAAPEVLLGTGHGKPCDIWSLGAITYTLLCGYTPFRSENINDFLIEVRENGVIFHHKYWKDVSSEAKEFVLAMLEIDPNKRLTAKQLLAHKWLTGETAKTADLLPTLKQNFNARSKLLQAIEAVKLANKIKALGLDEDDDDSPTNNGSFTHPTTSDAETLQIPALGGRRRSFGTKKGNATFVFQELVKSVSKINKASKDENSTENHK
ncbi:kinase-like domain-containing protein [Lipomyces japonicus]|uniref:kinase-like domain-containing protein n=1 Tax=Lipomyces japonicus TaxID=56871 RepID=UPI0034CEFDC4